MKLFDILETGISSAELAIYRNPLRPPPPSSERPAGQLAGRYIGGAAGGCLWQDVPGLAAAPVSYGAWEHHRSAMAYSSAVARGIGNVNEGYGPQRLLFDARHAVYEGSLNWALHTGGVPASAPTASGPLLPCDVLMLDNFGTHYGGRGYRYVKPGWSDFTFLDSTREAVSLLRGAIPADTKLVINLATWWDFPNAGGGFDIREAAATALNDFIAGLGIWGVIFEAPGRRPVDDEVVNALERFCTLWDGEVLWIQEPATERPETVDRIRTIIDDSRLWVWVR